jgi:hypothetical protein
MKSRRKRLEKAAFSVSAALVSERRTPNAERRTPNAELN